MSKGPPIPTPRPKRPVVELDDLPWRPGAGGGGVEPSPCAAVRILDVELSEPISAPTPVVAVPIDSDVRIISNGTVLATLATSVSLDLVACMRDGWRYSGQLTPITMTVGRLTLEGRRLE